MLRYTMLYHIEMLALNEDIAGLLPGQCEVPVRGGLHAVSGASQPVTSSSQTHLAITKSETHALLGNPPPGSSSSLKSEKRSLASKLSGTLNRSNSGKDSIRGGKKSYSFEAVIQSLAIFFQKIVKTTVGC